MANEMYAVPTKYSFLHIALQQAHSSMLECQKNPIPHIAQESHHSELFGHPYTIRAWYLHMQSL